MSVSGQYIFMSDLFSSYLSTNTGSSFIRDDTTFPQTKPSWACAIGPDGSMILTGSQNTGVWASFDSNATWNQLASTQLPASTTSACNWSVGCSKDGTMLFATLINLYQNGATQSMQLYYILKSTIQANGVNATWSSYYTGFSYASRWSFAVYDSNLDGSVVYIGGSNNSTVYKLTGMTTGSISQTACVFDSSYSNLFMSTMSTSSDGSVVILVGNAGDYNASYYYISTNSGASFTRYSLPTACPIIDVACSPNGNFMYIAANTINQNNQYASYFVSLTKVPTTNTFTTTSYTKTGLSGTVTYAISIVGNLTGGGSTTLYTGSVTTLA